MEPPVALDLAIKFLAADRSDQGRIGAVPPRSSASLTSRGFSRSPKSIREIDELRADAKIGPDVVFEPLMIPHDLPLSIVFAAYGVIEAVGRRDVAGEAEGMRHRLFRRVHPGAVGAAEIEEDGADELATAG